MTRDWRRLNGVLYRRIVQLAIMDQWSIDLKEAWHHTDAEPFCQFGQYAVGTSGKCRPSGLRKGQGIDGSPLLSEHFRIHSI